MAGERDGVAMASDGVAEERDGEAEEKDGVAEARAGVAEERNGAGTRFADVGLSVNAFPHPFFPRHGRPIL